MNNNLINNKENLEKEYVLEMGKTKIKIIIRLLENSIKISGLFINDSLNYFYENSFDKESFVKLNKCFIIYETIEQIINVILDLMEKNKCSINKVNEDEIKLNLKIQIISEEKEISLILHKNKNISKDNIINNLIVTINDLSKKVYELEKWKKENEFFIFNLKSSYERRNVLNYSNVLEREQELNLIENRLMIINRPIISYKLLFRGSKDGDDSLTFHKKCDNIPNQLVFVRTVAGYKFGGFTKLGFNSANKAFFDKDAFLFSFNTMRIYDAIEGKKNIYCYSSYGPTFGLNNDLQIKNKFFSNKGQVHTKMNRFKTNVDYELNGGQEFFICKEVEIFQVIFQENNY